jgi:hypothetical protein
MTSMFQIYSERQFAQSHPESEQEYFMRMARNMRDQQRRERRERIVARVTGRPQRKPTA